MNTKEWLRQYMRLRSEAEAIKRTLAELREMAASVRSPAMTGMPHSGTAKDMADVQARIDDHERRYASKLNEALSARDEIMAAIDALPDADERAVLRLRYISRYHWDHIAQTMHYSTRFVYVLHGRALKDIKISQK